MSRTRGAMAVLGLALLAGCAPEATASARDVAAIAGGTVTTGDPAVFLLDIRSDTGIETLCTATLIAPSTLVTAAHCVDPAHVGGTQLTVVASNAPTRAEVVPGVNTVQVTETRYHPRWNVAALEADLAVLALATPSTVVPAKWSPDSVASLGGAPVRAVGYGANAPDAGTGTKRTVDLTIRQLTPELILIGDLVARGLCHGDSGGPTFMPSALGEQLIGVHSFTRGEDCNDGADVRLDAYAPFLQQWLSDREDTCGADHVCSPTACASPDPDCLPLGAPCTSLFECAGRSCEGDAQHPAPYCSRPCTADADCGETLRCGDAGRCVKPQLPVVGNGQPCVSGQTFCEGGGLCAIAPGEEATRCHRPCAQTRECVGGSTCEAVAGGSVCAPPPPLRIPLATIEGPVGCAHAPGLAWALACLLALRRRPVRAATGPGNC